MYKEENQSGDYVQDMINAINKIQNIYGMLFNGNCRN